MNTSIGRFIPDATFDETLGYEVDDVIWIGNTFWKCIANSEGNAVWVNSDTPQHGSDVTYIRRSDYVTADRISYLAFAPQGSLETDAVWTITKRVGSSDGTIVSNVQYFNKKWTERGLL